MKGPFDVIRVATGLFVVVLFGCADGSKAGTLGEKCYSDGTCKPGLVCERGVCVLEDDVGDGTAICGNGVREGTEECDGTDFGETDQDCQSLGYYGGFLRCDPTTCKIDYTECEAAGKCGDGTMQESQEECDGSDFAAGDATGSDSCSAYGRGEGTVRCTEDCTLDFAGCSGELTCGNGIIDGEEQCDRAGTTEVFADPQLRQCPSKYYGGQVHCTDNCTLDYSDCEAHGWCGDGQLQEFETCEPGQLRNATCGTEGWLGGTLACDPTTCSYDYSQCKELILVDNGTTDGTFVFYDAVEDYNGNIIAVGFGEGVIAGASPRTSGNIAPLVMKFSPDGDIMWAQYIQTEGGEAYGVDTDIGGNIYVSGYFHGVIETPTGDVQSQNGTDGFVLKLSSSGMLHWVYTFGVDDHNDAAFKVACDRTTNNRLYFTGMVAGPVFGLYRGGFDGVLGVLNTDTGTLDSARSQQLGGEDDDLSYGIKWTANGSLFVSFTVDDSRNNVWDDGNIMVKHYLTTGGNLTQNREYNIEGPGVMVSVDIAPYLVIITSDGEVEGVAPKGGKDCFVVALDPMTGGTKWVANLGSSEDDYCTGIITYSSRVYVAFMAGGDVDGSHTVQGSSAMMMAKLDGSTGQILAYREWDGSDRDIIYSLNEGSSRAFVFSGATRSPSLEGEVKTSNVAAVLGRFSSF